MRFHIARTTRKLCDINIAIEFCKKKETNIEIGLTWDTFGCNCPDILPMLLLRL